MHTTGARLPSVCEPQGCELQGCEPQGDEPRETPRRATRNPSEATQPKNQTCTKTCKQEVTVTVDTADTGTTPDSRYPRDIPQAHSTLGVAVDLLGPLLNHINELASLRGGMYRQSFDGRGVNAFAKGTQ